MIYLLDTDLFTLAYLAKFSLRDRIEAARAENDVVVSLITRIEVLRGRFEAILKAADGTGLARMHELLRSSEAYLAAFPILPFTDAAIREFDRLRDDKKAKKVGRNDLLIACVALAHGVTVVTRNVKDFQLIQNLKVENWAA